MYKDLSENEWEKQPTSKVKTFREPGELLFKIT